MTDKPELPAPPAALPPSSRSRDHRGRRSASPGICGSMSCASAIASSTAAGAASGCSTYPPRRGGRDPALRSRPRPGRADRAVPPGGALWRPLAMAAGGRRRADRHRRDAGGGGPPRDPRGEPISTRSARCCRSRNDAGQRQPRRGDLAVLRPRRFDAAPAGCTASPRSTRTSGSWSRRSPRSRRCSTPARSRAPTRWSCSPGCCATATACAGSGAACDSSPSPARLGAAAKFPTPPS